MRTASYILVLLLMLTSLSQAQLTQGEEDNELNNQLGFAFTMAETGSGLGGFIAWPLFGGFHFGFSLGAYFIRDANQLDFEYYGTPVSINKQNSIPGGNTEEGDEAHQHRNAQDPVAKRDGHHTSDQGKRQVHEDDQGMPVISKGDVQNPVHCHQDEPG